MKVQNDDDALLTFTIDFLLAGAKARLAFAKVRGHDAADKPGYTGDARLMPGNDGPQLEIAFLPLAAAGGEQIQEPIRFYSEDHNFTVTYKTQAQAGPVMCEIQAQGYAAIDTFKNRQAVICFAGQHKYRIKFNDKGYAGLPLPLYSDDGKAWHTLPFNLTRV